ncbi:hypothetical protein Taro_024061, partial [Colocasia esculenta]|nr:hypothetical protein [Colocasia esculenta]
DSARVCGSASRHHRVSQPQLRVHTTDALSRIWSTTGFPPTPDPSGREGASRRPARNHYKEYAQDRDALNVLAHRRRTPTRQSSRQSIALCPGDKQKQRHGNSTRVQTVTFSMSGTPYNRRTPRVTSRHS